MISEHLTSQFFFKNNKNVLNNTTKFYLIENLHLDSCEWTKKTSAGLKKTSADSKPQGRL